jgi:YD repeat-containing protein
MRLPVHVPFHRTALRGSLSMFFLASSVAGCGETVPKDGSKDEVAEAAAALVRSLSFAGGSLRDGALPSTDANAVTLEALESDLVMKPGQPGIMALAPDNPDEADDPVTITLLQFALAKKKHFEIERPSDGEDGQIAHAFSLEDDVCASLCNREFRLEVHAKLKLRSGKIGRQNTRTVILDCTADGDPKACTAGSAGEGGSGDGDAGEGGTGGDDAGGSGGTGGGGAGGSGVTGGSGGTGGTSAEAACGVMITSTDAESGDRTYDFSYDADGRLSSFEDVTNMSSTQYTYDAQGRLTRMEEQNSDGSSNTTVLTYDASGRMVTLQEESGSPGDAEYEGQIRTFTYDADGNRTGRDITDLVTDELGDRAAYAYDDVGHLTSIESDSDGPAGVPDGVPDSRTVYTYDSGGNMISEVTESLDIEGAITSEDTKTYTYDDSGHLVEESRSSGGVVDVVKTFTYDAAGNVIMEERVSESDPTGTYTTTYAYDCDFTLTDACGADISLAFIDIGECPVD